jgi:hypothetical protein
MLRRASADSMSPPTRRVLLDECVDWRLSRHLRPHSVTTVAKVGWSGLKNGQLLRQAEADFDLLITVDRDLSFRQRLVDFDLAVIVLHASSNRLQDLLPLVPRILRAIPSAKPGHVSILS